MLCGETGAVWLPHVLVLTAIFDCISAGQRLEGVSQIFYFFKGHHFGIIDWEKLILNITLSINEKRFSYARITPSAHPLMTLKILGFPCCFSLAEMLSNDKSYNKE